MNKILLIVLVSLLHGCALKNTNLYGSKNMTLANQAIISALGVHDHGNLGLQITAINGEAVDMLKTASFIVPAGKYKIKVHANKDLTITTGSSGLGTTKKVADGEINVTVKGGHTYIPNAVIKGNKILFIFDDMGENFQKECLPLYVVVNTSSNPGFKVYETDKKCESNK